MMANRGSRRRSGRSLERFDEERLQTADLGRDGRPAQLGATPKTLPQHVADRIESNKLRVQSSEASKKGHEVKSGIAGLEGEGGKVASTMRCGDVHDKNQSCTSTDTDFFLSRYQKTTVICWLISAK